MIPSLHAYMALTLLDLTRERRTRVSSNCCPASLEAARGHGHPLILLTAIRPPARPTAVIATRLRKRHTHRANRAARTARIALPD